MKKPPLVEVHWIDARTIYERISWSEIVSKCRLADQLTVGYLVDRDDTRTIVAHTFDPCDGGEEPDGVDMTVIPSGWIKTVRYLERGPRKKKEVAA